MQSYNFYTSPMNMGLRLERATLEDVKKTPVAPNQTIYFLDPNEPYLYTKTTDQLGQAIIKGFKIEEVDLQKMMDNKKFITREDFDAFKAELLNVMKGGTNESSL